VFKARKVLALVQPWSGGEGNGLLDDLIGQYYSDQGFVHFLLLWERLSLFLSWNFRGMGLERTQQAATHATPLPSRAGSGRWLRTFHFFTRSLHRLRTLSFFSIARYAFVY
jgi:hypothetical protein